MRNELAAFMTVSFFSRHILSLRCGYAELDDKLARINGFDENNALNHCAVPHLPYNPPSATRPACRMDQVGCLLRLAASRCVAAPCRSASFERYKGFIA
jgi:hypothetical protein